MTARTTTLTPLRLQPGVDLRRALEAWVHDGGSASSAFVVAGIGSLANVTLRFAGESAETQLAGSFEIIGLSGTIGPNGAHLHMAVADASGRVVGGHVGYGNAVRTTAEILLAPLPGWTLAREHDAATGFDELVVRAR